MYIQPILRRVWDEGRGEVIELPEIYGFQALDKSGAVVGEGENREEKSGAEDVFFHEIGKVLITETLYHPPQRGQPRRWIVV